MVMTLMDSVGKNGKNLPADVTKVKAQLKEAGFYTGVVDGSYSQAVEDAIVAFQAIFLKLPDGKIDAAGNSRLFLGRWLVKPVKGGVLLPGNTKLGWDLLNPILPAGSTCTSGYRSTDDQRAILLGFYTGSYRDRILAIYDQEEYDRVLALPVTAARDRTMTEMVREAGQLIAVPGTSPHEKQKAFDIGGPNDAEQARVARMVAKANPGIFTGKVLIEKNGCVHVEVV